MAGGGTSHRAHGSCVVEYVASAGLHDLVHQVDQVRCLVRPLILLSKILNCVVHKVLENEKRLGGAFLVIMKEFEELSGILLAVGVTVWLVQKLKSLDEDVKASLKDDAKKAYLNDRALHYLVAEEALEDLDGSDAEVAVAKRDEEIVLQA